MHVAMPQGDTRGLRRGFGAAAPLWVALVLALVAFGSGTTPDETGGTGTAAGRGVSAKEVTDRDFDRGNFTNGARIDNKWSPLVPGTQFVLVGRADRGQGRRPHRVVLTVTDLTKVIDGVRSRVLWDRDYNQGRLVEGELAFHAQDDDGNVWNLGEYPEEYERGRFAGAPDTWMAGVARARAGILMRATPRAGTSSYLQGWAPEIDFADRARVSRTGQRNCVPLRCYRNVLVIDEWNPSEPGAIQSKYYAPGVGNIRAGAEGGKEREGLVLVRVAHLEPRAMSRVRREALKLERRAYAVSKSVYARTPPVRRDGR
jgi:hypothetical protein